MTELTEVTEGALMARTLFDGKALQTAVHIINLSDKL